MSIIENTCLTPVNVYASVYGMWNDDEIAEQEADETHCAECGERDLREAMVPVYVATRNWHKTERVVHPECRELFVASHLPAVLASIRGVRL